MVPSTFWTWLAQRLREPSTYVGLGSAFTAAGWLIAPEQWDKIAAVGMGLGGVIAALLGERSPPKPPQMPPNGLVVLLAAGLTMAACAQMQPVYDRSLGPADTAPQRVYRLAGALDVVGQRLASEPRGPAVRAYWGRAEASFQAAYAAVAADNAPAALPALIGRGSLDLYALVAAAGLTDAMRIAPAMMSPVTAGMLPAEIAVEAATAIPLYAAALPRLRMELTAMTTAGADPLQTQWDARLASIALSRAAIAR